MGATVMSQNHNKMKEANKQKAQVTATAFSEAFTAASVENLIGRVVGPGVGGL